MEEQSRLYELVIIIAPREEDKASAVMERVQKWVSDRGGEVTLTDRWGRKKLAYPIKRFNEGEYVLTRLKLAPSMVRELEDSLRLWEDVIRHLVVKLDGQES